MSSSLPRQSAIEWGIVYARTPDELHRGPMTEEDAREWLREFEADGGRPGAFVLVRRKVGQWRTEASVV